jgi:hypothetical protein
VFRCNYCHACLPRGIACEPVFEPCPSVRERQAHTDKQIPHSRNPRSLGYIPAGAPSRTSDAGIPVLAGTDTSVFGVLVGVSRQLEEGDASDGGRRRDPAYGQSNKSSDAR